MSRKTVKPRMTGLLVRVALLLLLTAAQLSAQDEGETTLMAQFRAANQAYSEGAYALALKGYRELLDAADPSAELYYNTGCAALKTGELGEAVVNFHRASRLNPRDPDIRFNLQFVGELTRPKGEEEEAENVFFGLLSRLVFSLTTREASIIQLAFLLVFTLGAVTAATGAVGGKRKFALALTLTGLFLLLVNSSVLGLHIYRFTYVSEAVVLQADVEALSGPGEDNTRVLVIPEGTVMRVREQRGDWALVSLPSGRSGWLRLELIEVI
ncbi:MAG: hypothetical protein FVQ81_01680 [Candidatus Glassbacteria bacterium]|nr:hypothetical protein [Candidatus Glassbacteria bacterium]